MLLLQSQLSAGQYSQMETSEFTLSQSETSSASRACTGGSHITDHLPDFEPYYHDLYSYPGTEYPAAGDGVYPSTCAQSRDTVPLYCTGEQYGSLTNTSLDCALSDSSSGDDATIMHQMTAVNTESPTAQWCLQQSTGNCHSELPAVAETTLSLNQQQQHHQASSCHHLSQMFAATSCDCVASDIMTRSQSAQDTRMYQSECDGTSVGLPLAAVATPITCSSSATGANAMFRSTSSHTSISSCTSFSACPQPVPLVNVKCERFEPSRCQLNWTGSLISYGSGSGATAPVTTTYDSGSFSDAAHSATSSLHHVTPQYTALSYTGIGTPQPNHSQFSPIVYSSPSVSSFNAKFHSSSADGTSKSGDVKKPHKPQLFCAVCGDNAACLHYGVRTCEGCKGFFKRTVQKNSKYVCTTGEQNCVVDKRRRNRCQYCRFQKCLEHGMVREVVRTDALKGRRGRLPSKVRLTCNRDTTSTTTSSSSSSSTAKPLATALIHAQMSTWSCTERNAVERDVDIGSHGSETVDDVNQLFQIIGASWDRVGQFAAGIPGFDQLCQSDFQRLVQCAAVEVLVLRLAHSYNPDNETFLLDSGAVLHRSRCHPQLRSWMDSIVTFALKLRSFSIDLATLSCLTALTIMSERRSLENVYLVQRLRSQILSLLQEHIASGNSCTAAKLRLLWPQLSQQLTEVNRLGNQCLHQLFYLRRQGYIDVPPFIRSLLELTLS